MHATPNDIYLKIEDYNNKKEEEYDLIIYKSWLNGLYHTIALSSFFNKSGKYPDSPLNEKKKGLKEVAKKSGKTEAQLQQELLYMQLRVRQVNSEIEKVGSESE